MSRRGCPLRRVAALSLGALVLVACTATREFAAAKADAAWAGALDLRGAPIVLLGEVHDNAAQHAARLRAFRDLLGSGARPALLMEQFDRERQSTIDRMRVENPLLSAADLVAAVGAPTARWNWQFYSPFVELALRNGLPIVAANVSAADARRVMQEGLGAAGFEAAVPPDIVQAQVEAIERGHCGAIDAALARRMASAQVARDQFMAGRVEANAGRGVVLLAGNGHVRKDRGVPRWLSDESRARSVAIGLLEEGDDSHSAFDHALTTPSQPREDPCATFPRRPGSSSS